MNFSAVILAGGNSSRMGRDKAFLKIGGQTLLARQLSLAHELGASETFISGRADVDYSEFNHLVLQDELCDRGPLAGIAAALKAMSNPLLLVLAVDMANMTSKYLAELRERCRDGSGAVAIHDKILEPLAAFYPKSAATLAQKLLSPANGKSAGAKHFADSCMQAGLAQAVSVEPGQLCLFQSCNSPADMRIFNCS